MVAGVGTVGTWAVTSTAYGGGWPSRIWGIDDRDASQGAITILGQSKCFSIHTGENTWGAGIVPLPFNEPTPPTSKFWPQRMFVYRFIRNKQEWTFSGLHLCKI